MYPGQSRRFHRGGVGAQSRNSNARPLRPAVIVQGQPLAGFMQWVLVDGRPTQQMTCTRCRGPMLIAPGCKPRTTLACPSCKAHVVYPGPPLGPMPQAIAQQQPQQFVISTPQPFIQPQSQQQQPRGHAYPGQYIQQSPAQQYQPMNPQHLPHHHHQQQQQQQYPSQQQQQYPPQQQQQHYPPQQQQYPSQQQQYPPYQQQQQQQPYPQQQQQQQQPSGEYPSLQNSFGSQQQYPPPVVQQQQQQFFSGEGAAGQPGQHEGESENTTLGYGNTTSGAGGETGGFQGETSDPGYSYGEGARPSSGEGENTTLGYGALPNDPPPSYDDAVTSPPPSYNTVQ